MIRLISVNKCQCKPLKCILRYLIEIELTFLQMNVLNIGVTDRSRHHNQRCMGNQTVLCEVYMGGC